MEKNPPENSVLVNVCVIPNDEVGKKCVAMSQSIQSDATMFALDGKTKFSHMTVFMARFALDQVSNVVTAAGQALKEVKSFECKQAAKPYFMTKGRYFEASYEKSEPFVALHERLIEALKEYRLNPGHPYEEGYFTPYTKEQQKNVQETGYDLAHNLFRPHVTLTRYYEGKMPEKDPEMPLANLSFLLHKICVYKADDNGAVYEKLAEFVVK